MSEMIEIPEKSSYKFHEVCQYTDTQAYVIRFWESEFPQLTPEKSRGGQPVYSRRDIDTILRIKQLLHEEECTLDGARRKLAAEQKRGRKKGTRRAAPAKKAKKTPRASAVKPAARPEAAPDKRRSLSRQEPLEFDTVPRERYEDAIDEIAHLRLEVKEAEKRARKAEVQGERQRQIAEELRRRRDRAVAALEKLLERLI